MDKEASRQNVLAHRGFLMVCRETSSVSSKPRNLDISWKMVSWNNLLPCVSAS